VTNAAADRCRENNEQWDLGLAIDKGIVTRYDIIRPFLLFLFTVMTVR